MSPEELRANERLAALPADLLTSAFRDTVIASARAAAWHREFRDALQRATEELEAAQTAGDFEATLAAAIRLAGLGAPQIARPSTDLDPRAVAEVMSIVASRIRDAALPPLPSLASEREFAAWRSIGDMNIHPPAPPVTPAEATAVLALNDLKALRQPAERTSDAWLAAANRHGVDVFAHLGAGAGTVKLLEDYRHKHDQVVELVAEADLARAAAGLSWAPPSGINTPELVALAGSRRS